MQKAIVTFFFSALFLMSVLAPSLVTMLDSTYEISLLEKTTEGEEENKEAPKDLETEILYSDEGNSLHFITKKTRALSYYFKKYNSISQDLFLPPPEQATV